MGFRSLCATSLGALASLPVAKRSIPFAIAAGLVFSSNRSSHKTSTTMDSLAVPSGEFASTPTA